MALGPVSRFGTVELTVPRRTRSVAEVLLQPDGAPSDRTLAQRLVRMAETAAETETGRRFRVRAAPGPAELAWPRVDQLARRMGARFETAIEAGWPRDRLEVAPL